MWGLKKYRRRKAHNNLFNSLLAHVQTPSPFRERVGVRVKTYRIIKPL
jgi:hypothetical protein